MVLWSPLFQDQKKNAVFEFYVLLYDFRVYIDVAFISFVPYTVCFMLH